MDSDVEQRFSQSAGLLLLWFGWAIGPLAWMIHLSVSYLLAPRACATGNYLTLYIVTAAMLLAAASGALLNWHLWHKFGRVWPDSSSALPHRSRFMCVVGLLTNLLFFVVIVAQGIPILILRAC